MARIEQPSRNDLIERVYRHYPRGVADDAPQRRSGTVEARRLVCVQEAAARACQWEFYEVPEEWRVPIDDNVRPVLKALRAWRSMAEEWAAEVPSIPLWDESNPWHDACYRYSAVRSDYVADSGESPDSIAAVVSILAPVYAIFRNAGDPGETPHVQYSNFPDRHRDRIEKLSTFIERMFGFHRLDEESLRLSLPDVVPGYSNLRLGEATLRDCLFTSESGAA